MKVTTDIGLIFLNRGNNKIILKKRQSKFWQPLVQQIVQKKQKLPNF